MANKIEPKVVDAHSEAYDRIVEDARARLRHTEMELNTLLRQLYGNNMARMSGGKRGQALPKHKLRVVVRNRTSLEKQVEDIKKELKHLGAL